MHVCQGGPLNEGLCAAHRPAASRQGGCSKPQIPRPFHRRAQHVRALPVRCRAVPPKTVRLILVCAAVLRSCNAAAVRSPSPLPTLTRGSDATFRSSRSGAGDNILPNVPVWTSKGASVSRLSEASLSQGEALMKAERDNGLFNGACTCCMLEDDLEVAVEDAPVGASRMLRGGSGGGVTARHEEEGGRIEMIVGPMFAGKSTELMRRIRRHKLAYRRCVVIKYAKDQRHGETITELSTHDNNRIKALVPLSPMRTTCPQSCWSSCWHMRCGISPVRVHSILSSLA
jgi:hypothetical protein